MTDLQNATTATFADQEIRHLLKRRSTIKAQITQFHTFIDSMQNNPDFDHIQTRSENLEKYFDEFKSVQVQLETQQPDNTDHDNARVEIEAKYCHGIARARTLLRRAEEGTRVSEPSITSRETVNPSSVITTYKRLPELTPPKFDGHVENWTTFKTRFESMINQNPHLSDSDKLQYLQSALTDRATRAIESLALTDSNYAGAWKLLIDKYDNTRKAILRHVHILMNIEPLNNDSAEAIEDLVDTVRQQIQSLKNLGQDDRDWDCFIIGILTQKLSTELTRQWELNLSDNKLPSYTSLLDFLAKRASCLDTQPSSSTRTTASKDKSKSKQKKGSDHQTLATEVKTPECPMCQAGHPIYFCPKFMELSANQRIKAAQQAQLCLNCLRGQHKIKSCKSKGRCRTCNLQHHTTLHLQGNEPSENSL